MLENKEIRNLKEGTLYNVVQILDINDDWKRFMSLIPMDPQKENSDLKYNIEDIKLIEEYSKQSGEKCAKILFDEWGTSGQIRPTLRTLQQIALKADMMRVADEIANLLEEAPPPRPQRGPGAPVSDNLSELLKTSTEIRDTTAQMKSENNGTNQLESDTQNQPNWQKILNSVEPSTDQSQTQQSNNETTESDIQPSYYQPHNQTSDSQQSSKQTSDYSDTQTSDSQLSKDPMPNYQQSHQSDFVPSEFQDSVPNLSVFQNAIENVTLSSRIDKSILQDANLTHFDYSELDAITNSFSDDFKIGIGGFGEVFKAPHPTLGLLAIKKTHIQFQHKQEVAIKIFNSEVKYLSQFRHENIVPILGFSKNGPVPCIVCEYIEGGSLYGKIAAKCLTERQRLAIMRGTAEGLRYLHSYKVERSSHSVGSDPSMQSVSKTNFVHGDVKSANILLTKDFVPKLCDFGLAKQYDQTCITPNVMGTSVYMAPEALHGTVTQKSDIYSFGIVLLELLTGLRPLVIVIDPTSEVQTQIQIVLYMEESVKRYGRNVRDLLDRSAGEWARGEEVYALAKKCCEYDRHDRPSSQHICDVLRALQDM